jgi:hypothetical protein
VLWVAVWVAICALSEAYAWSQEPMPVGGARAFIEYINLYAEPFLLTVSVVNVAGVAMSNFIIRLVIRIRLNATLSVMQVV